METVWIHTPSVGEYNTAKPLLEFLKKSNHRLVVTYSSPRAENFFKEQKIPDEVIYLNIPSLLTGKGIEKFLKKFTPKRFILVESDRYPVLLSVKVEKKFIVNARISGKSFKFLRIFRGFYARLFNTFDKIICKDRKTCAKFRSIGVNPKILTTCGNLKAVFSPKVVSLPFQLKGFVLVAGSTHKGEEEILLSAFGEIKRKIPSAVLVIAPRHIQRAKEVLKIAKERFSNFKVLLRSQVYSTSFEGDVLIVDSLGELLGFYKTAEVTFVGGSLVPVGGHNLLEPAYFGKPVMFGPFVEKFRDLEELLKHLGLAFPVKGAKDITATVLRIYREGIKPKGDLRVISKRIMECYKRKLQL